MAITYGFFNSVNGDRRYDADQMSEYFNGLVSDGVYEDVGNALQVLATGTDMTVNVQTGRGIIDCKWIKNDTILPLTVTASHATLPRYTAVVMRLDRSNRQMLITTVDGEAASTPVEPTMSDTDTVKELCLAMIYVGAGVTAITQDKINDRRPSSSCGWVTGLIDQVDTSTLFLQYQTAYENYFAYVQEQFNDFLSSLAQDLNVNTYVEKYQKVVTLSSSNVISLDMTGYTYDVRDIIDVHINGLLGVAGTDYTLDTSGSTPTITTEATASGTVVVIDVIKSVIGFPTLGTELGNTLVTESDDPIIA